MNGWLFLVLSPLNPSVQARARFVNKFDNHSVLKCVCADCESVMLKTIFSYGLRKYSTWHSQKIKINLIWRLFFLLN